MSTLEVQGESVLSKSLNRFWRRVIRKLSVPRLAKIEEQTDLSWNNFRNQEECNVFPKDVFEEVLRTAPCYAKDSALKDTEAAAISAPKSNLATLKDESTQISGTVCTIGAFVGDIPTVVTIKGLLPNELPVKGTLVHPRIVAGFSYIVRPVDSYKPLFNGKAVRLQRIGMGYGKRLTFAGDSLHESNNYFWSDTNPEGYGFSLELVHVGDKFTVLNIDNQPVAYVEVAYVMGAQKETDESIKSTNRLEKQSYVSLQCNISYFEDIKPSNDSIIVSGVAIAIKKSKSRLPASVVRVRDCFINGDLYTLVPTTIDVIQRSKSVSGEAVCDIPTSYCIAGLLPNELPVIGTYVDPKITPGFKYKVRPVDSNRHLFGGNALTLCSIGRGYGKRLTFAGESLKETDNYFWSDTNPEGYGFTLEAVSKGDSFRIVDNCGGEIGEARVFQLCGPQIELESFLSKENRTFTKSVQVSMACHLSLKGDQSEITTRVKGCALVERKCRNSSVHRIQNLEFPCLFSKQNLNECVAFVKESN